jgi:predicted house-cleaning noncanonical NTP pyrophosphatase (MazG superfamily)
MANKRFFILGDNASIFFDPKSRLKVVTNKPVPFEGKDTVRIETALKHGHIKELKADEMKKYLEQLDEDAQDTSNDSSEKTLEDMTKAELVGYFTDNFEYTDEQLDEFKAKKKAEMIEFIEAEE